MFNYGKGFNYGIVECGSRKPEGISQRVISYRFFFDLNYFYIGNIVLYLTVMEITNYFDKTATNKRQLSEQSNNGDEPKKLRKEGSQTDSGDVWDDVFLVGLPSDQANSAMIQFMKRFEAQLKDLHNTTEQTKNSQIKGEEHLRELTKFIEFANNRFDEYEKEKKEKDELIKNLRKDVNDMAGIIDNLSLGLDRQEQYSR